MSTRKRQKKKQRGKGGIMSMIPGLNMPWGSAKRMRRRWNMKKTLPPIAVWSVRNSQMSNYLKKLGVAPPKKL